MKMFLISDNVDTYTGMRLAGVEGVVVHEREELKKALAVKHLVQTEKEILQREVDTLRGKLEESNACLYGGEESRGRRFGGLVLCPEKREPIIGGNCLLYSKEAIVGDTHVGKA